jgi:hypothetical protein
MRARTSINRLSLALTVEFRIHRSSNNYPGYPRGWLLVVKHRQLARQVGAFGGFASESSTNLDNTIFSTGSTFIFGSWICEADDDGKLQGHLIEDLARHEDLTISTTTTDQLAGRFTWLACLTRLRFHDQPILTQTQAPHPRWGLIRVLSVIYRVLSC